MATERYVDPNDDRLLEVKEKGEDILNEYETGMQDAINANTNAMNDALDEIGEMGEDGKWTKGSATEALVNAQNEQTDFAIEQIKQSQEQAEKDYIKEQAGAWADYRKQTAKHGVNAEIMAANGLENSGYAESSKVAMYNQYQARVTAAREAFVKANQDFENQMTNARLQNNSTLAQLYRDAYKQRLEVLTQFTFQNTELLTTLAQQKAAIKQQNESDYQSVYNQLLQEVQIRQDDEHWQQEHAGSDDTTGGGTTGNDGYRTKAGIVNNMDNVYQQSPYYIPDVGIAPTFNSYSEAVQYMKKHGVPNAYASGIRGQSEWSRQQTKSQETYQEYLRRQVTFIMTTKPWEEG